MKKIQNPIHWLKVDEKGSLSVILGILKPGRVSAIATHPNYGTSEPAVNAVVKSLNSPVDGVKR